MAFGKIYKTSWWGSGNGIQNNIGFGNAYDYIREVEFLENRAEEDGGTTEGWLCASNVLKRYVHSEGSRVLMDAYTTRVETAGGTVEAKQCAINEINDL